MEGERRRPITSERATLDPFEALAGDVRTRDQRDLMERPFFSLAKAKRVRPILYKTGDTQVQVYAVPEHRMATVWAADVLIWAASLILTTRDRGLPTSRFFRFTPYQLLIAVGRATGNREYQLLKGALTRPQSTVIRTTIRHDEHWRRQQFSWVNEWEELTTRLGRSEGMEFVLPEWSIPRRFSNAGSCSPSIPPTSRSRAASNSGSTALRKHARHQREGWRFELGHLHAKSASLARFSDFVLDIRRIVARQLLPGYAFALERHDDRRELMVMRPSLSTEAVRKPWVSPIDIGTSGANDIGISGASISGLRAYGSPSSLCTDSKSPMLKDSKAESKSSSAASIRHGKGRDDAASDRGSQP
jgi:plasmid replication initiation protein